MKIIHLSGTVDQQAKSQVVEQLIENWRNFVAVVNAADKAILDFAVASASNPASATNTNYRLNNTI